jgi:hypothetical protein
MSYGRVCSMRPRARQGFFESIGFRGIPVGTRTSGMMDDTAIRMRYEAVRPVLDERGAAPVRGGRGVDGGSRWDRDGVADHRDRAQHHRAWAGGTARHVAARGGARPDAPQGRRAAGLGRRRPDAARGSRRPGGAVDPRRPEGAAEVDRRETAPSLRPNSAGSAIAFRAASSASCCTGSARVSRPTARPSKAHIIPAASPSSTPSTSASWQRLRLASRRSRSTPRRMNRSGLQKRRARVAPEGLA